MKGQGKHKVTVPTVNVAQLIAENVIPGDWVMLKMDIECAEYDVVPCLAQSPMAKLADIMYLEEHPLDWCPNDAAAAAQEMAAAKQKLKGEGVDVPDGYASS